MNEVVCPACGVKSPEDALFCMRCGGPVRCLHCAASIPLNALACIKCGKPVPAREFNDGQFARGSFVQPDYNRYTVHQRDGSYSYDMEFLFSNAVAQQTGEFLARLPGFGERATPSRPIPQQSGEAPSVIELDGQPAVPLLTSASDLHATQVGQTDTPPAGIADFEERALRSVFAERDGKLTLQRSDLKANSQTDQVLRLAHLFIYAHQILLGEQTVARTDVYEVTDFANLPRDNVAAYISRDSSIVKNSSGDILSLNLTGLDHARECLREIMDPTIAGKYVPAKDAKSSAKPKKPRKSGDAAIDENQLETLVQHPETQALARDIPHNVIADLPLLEQITIALYGLHKAGLEDEVYYGPIAQYLYEAFDVKAVAESIRSRLRTAMSNHDKNIVHKNGEGYRITSSGIKHVETTYRRNPERLPQQLGLTESESA